MRKGISIHAPREGRDGISRVTGTFRCLFQSTRPVRGATDQSFHFLVALFISIHAPREGRDVMPSFRQTTRVEISIHAPREGRDRDPNTEQENH